MLLGMSGYFGTPLDVEAVLRIVREFLAECGDLHIEVMDKSTAKFRRTKKIQTLEKWLSVDTYAAVIAAAVRNEAESMSIDISGNHCFHLPYKIQVNRDVDEGQVPAVERFFDHLVVSAKCEYAFGILADTDTELYEELSFMDKSSWASLSSEEIFSPTGRRKYLRILNDLRREFGRLIPQLYPLNYISDEMLVQVEGILTEFTDCDRWLKTRIDGIAKVAFLDILNKAEFRPLQDEIRRRLWERYDIGGIDNG